MSLLPVIMPQITQFHIPTRSHVYRGRRGSVDLPRASYVPKRNLPPEEYREELRKKRASDKSSVGTSPKGTENGDDEQEQQSERSFPLVNNSNSHHPDEEEDYEHHGPKRPRDRSAPPSYDTSRRQKTRLPTSGSTTSSQDKLLGNEHAPNSFTARSVKSKIMSPDSLPVASNEDDPLSKSLSSIQTESENARPIPTSKPRSSSGAIISAVQQCQETTTTAPSDREHGSQAPISDSTKMGTLTTNEDSKTPSNVTDLNSICQDFQAIIEKLEKKNNDLHKRLEQLQEENIVLIEDSHTFAETNKGLVEENDKLVEENNNLMGDNNKLVEKVEDLRDLLTSKATVTTTSGASLIPDTEVQARWNSLCFSIRQCMTQLVTNTISSSTCLHESVYSGFHGLNPNQVALLVPDKRGCRLLAEAIIWRVLAEHIFSNGTRMSRMFWAGNLSDGVRCLSDGSLESCHGQKKLKSFHSWRRQTATFLSELAAPNDVDAHIKLVLATIETRLGAFLQGPWPTTLRRTVWEIISSAVRLDCDLSQQLAYWYVDYPTCQPDNRRARNQQPLLMFDSTLMKGPEVRDQNQAVALVVSPVLFKAGDSHGQGYEGQPNPACKCEVICYEEPPAVSRDWRGYQVPQGVALVVDPMTQRLRQQQQQEQNIAGAAENGARIGKRVFQTIVQSIGIVKGG